MFQIDSPFANFDRTYHWSPASQRRFIARLAETGSVQQACAAVSMARESAYRYRRRVGAVAFRTGWDAAVLIAQERHGDELAVYAYKAVEFIGLRHPDTRRLRWRQVDPALGRGKGPALLNRLDRSNAALARRGRDHALAQTAACRFEDFLALIEHGLPDAVEFDFLARAGEPDLRSFICDLSQNFSLPEPHGKRPISRI